MSDMASRCTCEGGHVLLCPEHAEEAMGLLARMGADECSCQDIPAIEQAPRFGRPGSRE